MEKHYCDICGGETPAGYVKATSETAQIFSGAGFQDVCCRCLGRAKSISWREVVQSAIGKDDIFSDM